MRLPQQSIHRDLLFHNRVVPSRLANRAQAKEIQLLLRPPPRLVQRRYSNKSRKDKKSLPRPTILHSSRRKLGHDLHRSALSSFSLSSSVIVLSSSPPSASSPSRIFPTCETHIDLQRSLHFSFVIGIATVSKCVRASPFNLLTELEITSKSLWDDLPISSKVIRRATGEVNDHASLIVEVKVAMQEIYHKIKKGSIQSRSSGPYIAYKGLSNNV